MDGALLRRAANALYGMLIADALAMPVHWFYNPADITKQFGTIRDFQPAPAFHPSSIMNLHSTCIHPFHPHAVAIFFRHALLFSCL